MKIVLEKLKNIFLCNGFDPEEIRHIRYNLVDVTVEGFKKLAIGMGIIYVVTLIFERDYRYLKLDIIYLIFLSIFLLMINVFQRTKKYYLAEFATVFFVVSILTLAIYDSTICCVDSRGVFFPVFLVLIAVTFTGNPLAIDILMLLMTIIYFFVSYHVKNSYYFEQDFFTGFFTLLLSNMVNAMVSRSRISMILKTDAEKTANEANEAKSKFLSRMSHDIRTPMNAIIGLTDIVLDDESLRPDTRENMKSIKSSSDFLLGLINDILDVSKIEADEMELHPEPYLKDEFINYLNTMIRPLCDAKGIQFVVNSEKTRYPYVMLDKVRFNQVFFNLLSNAVKFTPSGGTITVDIEHIKDDGKYLMQHIMIADTGIGMSEEFQKHMFDPFSQENKEHINERQGSGLGLSIVKRVVDLMDGTLKVESEPGKGTTYHIYLNLEICEGKKEEKIEYNIDALKGKRVLLCEDHPINRQIAQNLLEKQGIETEIAVDGMEGVGKFQKSSRGYYDAILMDIRMPNMGGLEASRVIRGSLHVDAQKVPIIAMTANVFDTDRQASLEAGMNDHIGKPIKPELLYQTLAKYIANSVS